MLINPQSLLSLGASLLGGDASVTSLQGLLGGDNANLGAQFGNMLNGDTGGLTLISTENLTNTLNAQNLQSQNLAGQILPATANPIQQQTLSYLEQILSAKPIVEGQNLTSENSAENPLLNSAISDSQSEMLKKIQGFIDQNSDAISQATPDEVKGLMDTITQLVAAAQANNSPVIPQAGVVAASINPEAKIIDAKIALEARVEILSEGEQKVDPRILGKDNLQTAVAATNNKGAQVVTNLLEDNKSLFENKILATKAASADYDITGSRITGYDNLTRNILDGKLAVINPAAVRASTAEAGAYGIAKINKGTNKIEITLEPAALGKVDIRFDFTSDGKTNLIVTAERKETLDLLQKDAKYFEKILSESGIKADSGSLSFNMRQQGSGMEQQSNQQRGFFNQFNMAVPIVDESGNSLSNNYSYSNLSAYGNNNAISGLNILV
jgi:Flagellar hook-length control protein FliK